MSFREWIEYETGVSWSYMMGDTTYQQRQRLYYDYEQYCKFHDMHPIWDFGGKNNDK